MKSQIGIALLLMLGANGAPAFADNWQQLYDNASQQMNVESYSAAQQVFETMLKTRDQDATQQLLTRAGLAETLLWQGKFDESAKLFKDVMKKVSILGDRQEAGDIYDAYAWLMQSQGKNEEAYIYAKQALELRRRILPGTNDEVAQSLEHLAQISEHRGLFKDAADLYTQALAIRRQGGESQAVQSANLMEKLASVQYRVGNRAAAQQLFNDALADKSLSAAVFQQYTPHPAFQTLMYRYAQGAPNVSMVAVNGESLASITTPDNVTVQATVLPATDFKGMTAFVRVFNNGHRPIEFMPKPPSLVQIAPEVKLFEILQTDKLAQQIEKKGKRSASLIRFFQGDATTTVNSQVWSSGGYVRPGFGWGSNPYGYQPYNQRISPQMTTISTQVPDWEARARAEAKAQAAVAKATEAATLLREQKLMPCTINPGDMMQGGVQFDAKSIKEGLFRVSIGNALFEFPVGN